MPLRLRLVLRRIAMTQHQWHGRCSQGIPGGAAQQPLDDPSVTEGTHKQHIVTPIAHVLHQILVRITLIHIHRTGDTLVCHLTL
jgi:hypothetical protein